MMPDEVMQNQLTTCGIAVMSKLPRAGHSKTRLCPPLTPEQAARLSGAFLRDVTEGLAAAARQAAITAYAAYAPAGVEAELRPHLAPGTVPILADGSSPVPPGVEGFGRCLLHATDQVFRRGHASAGVLSSDTPTLPTEYLVRAADLLAAGDGRRVVLGACDDGGYYFLGMTARHWQLFAHTAWSTDSVAATTRRHAQALGLELIELPRWYDVDGALSLAQLRRETGGYPAPTTRNALAALGPVETAVRAA